MARIKNYGEDQPYLVVDWMTIDSHEFRIVRRIMGVWEVVGKVGGIGHVFTVFLAYFFNKYSFINFRLMAINEFFVASSQEECMNHDDECKVKVSTC